MLSYELLDNTSLGVFTMPNEFAVFSEQVRSNAILPDLFNSQNVPCEQFYDIIVDNMQCPYCIQATKEESIFDESVNDDLFDAYFLNIINENGQIICSLRVDSEWVLDGVEEQYIIESLYQCLLDIIYDDHSYDYASQYLRLTIPEQIYCLMIVSLSGTYMEDDENFDWMYARVSETAPEGWDVIFSHYKYNDRVFPWRGWQMDLNTFVSLITYMGEWQKDNDIWLWACDAGVPCDDGYSAASAMAALTGANVKAPLGRLFIAPSVYHTPECPDYTYSIVNVMGTKWENLRYEDMENKTRVKFYNYLNRHNLVRKYRAWGIFYPEGGFDYAD